MTELVNTHCHSFYCGHGEGQISEYVNEAKKAGLTTLAFTEHFPLSKAFDPDGRLSVPAKSWDLYIADVQKAREENPDIEILLGVEFDYLSDTEDRVFEKDLKDKFDLAYGSLHFVDRWAIDDPDKRDVWEIPGETDRIWKRYIELWCEAAADTSQPFGIMAHPDLVKKFAYYPSFSLDDAYVQMAEAAKAGGKMIEVNTSGAYYACKEIYPTLPLLKEFRRASVKCTVGTDAHTPENVARDIDKAYELLRTAGYSEINIPTIGGDLRQISLDD